MSSSNQNQSSIKDHFPVVAKANAPKAAPGTAMSKATSKSLAQQQQQPPTKRIRLNLNLNPQHLPSSDDSAPASTSDPAAAAASSTSPPSPAESPVPSATLEPSPPPSPPRRKTRLATRLAQLNARAATVTAAPLPPRPSASLIPAASAKPTTRKRKIQLVLDDDDEDQALQEQKQVTATSEERAKLDAPATPTRRTAAGPATPVKKTPKVATPMTARVANALARLDSPRRASPAATPAFQFSPRPAASSGPATPISAAERLLSLVPPSSSSPLKSSPAQIASKPSSLRARLDKLNAKASTPLPTTPRSTALATTPPSSSPSTRLIDTLPHIQDLLPPGGGSRAPIRSVLPRASTGAAIPSASLRTLSSTLESDPHLAKILLPAHLAHLVAAFKALETVVWYNVSRGDQTVLVHVAKAVQAQCHRRFDAEVLGKIVAVFPGAYTLEGVKTRNPNNVGPDVSSVSVEFNPEWDHDGVGGEQAHVGPRAVTDLLIKDKPKRLTQFRQRAIQLVAAAHNAWLSAQGLDVRAWTGAKRDPASFWHPEFNLGASVPDVVPADLPAYAPAHLGPNVKHLIPTAGEMRTQRLAREAAARDAANAVGAAQGGEGGAAAAEAQSKKKLTVAERAQQLRDRMAARESAAKALVGANVPPEVKHRLLVLSRVVLVANTIFTFFQMKSKPVVSLRDLADAVQRSSPTILSIDSAIDHITVLTEIAPACFEMVKVGIVRHVRKGDAAAPALVKDAVDREKARLQEQAAAGGGAVAVKGAAGKLLLMR